MRARDIMTRRVHSVRATATVNQIVRTMIGRRVSAVPVVDGNRRVLGIVSEGDLLRRVEIGTDRRKSWWYALLADPTTRARDYVKSNAARAADIMTTPVMSISDTTDVAEIVDLMQRWDIKRVPVVKDGKLVGIVSRRDVIRSLGKTRGGAARARGDDASIREHLRKKLSSLSWTDAALVNFIVDKGMIELNGMVPSADQRDAIRVMAEGIPGVRKVKDKLQVRPAALYYA
ncbi:MAG TPA: CBS domain-containing protein [Alphaproteobacteria bacterium]|nr:CBS domain-containing protein [Alphaproteobacteria bacterium]